jgi:hypothetical protein
VESRDEEEIKGGKVLTIETVTPTKVFESSSSSQKRTSDFFFERLYVEADE